MFAIVGTASCVGSCIGGRYLGAPELLFEDEDDLILELSLQAMLTKADWGPNLVRVFVLALDHRSCDEYHE
jgi:hypothetical protein